MENVKTPSETEQHTMKVVRARRILNEMNVPKITDQAVAALVKHLGVFAEPKVFVVDESGAIRMGARYPMTGEELVRDLLQDEHSEDARAIRWKPHGLPV